MGNVPVPTLLSLLVYDGETGTLTWCQRPTSLFTTEHHADAWNTKFAGKRAFTSLDRHGYCQSHVLGRVMRAHRVIWAMHIGHWDFGDIDHINGDRQDNRFCNLRPASKAENNRNVRPSAGASSKYLGVSLDKASGKWTASIRVDGKKKHLGRFSSELDAARSYDAAAIIHYGKFANPNFRSVQD